MRSIFGKLTTPGWYPKFCGVVALSGWLPFVLTPPLMHGGTLATEILGWTGLVLGGYCSLELVRWSPSSWRSAPPLAGCAIYGAAVAIGLYFALPIIPRVFESIL